MSTYRKELLMQTAAFWGMTSRATAQVMRLCKDANASDEAIATLVKKLTTIPTK